MIVEESHYFSGGSTSTTHIVDTDVLSVIPHIYPSIKIKDDYYVSFDNLIHYYVWEKGTFCGRKGKKIRDFI